MLFSSITFLYYFLPCAVILYYIVPAKLKNSVLLAFSLIFYGWGEPRYVFLMMATVVSGYVFGLLIEKYRETNWDKVFCGLSVGISLALLVYFKYADFFIENFNKVTGLSVPVLRVALPIGISFYTFQIISYAIDVYRGGVAQRNLINLAAYIAMFPQLIAGPIVRYSDIEEQLRYRRHKVELAAAGIRRFVIGLAKKILLANQLGELCNVFRGAEEKTILFYWMYAVAFALHVYFDFSGYSDMAIGLGKLFGFRFQENFNYPFMATSVTEFWRRWHISLGTWFRDYVYIPLGGNRVKPVRQIVNILVVWFLTGFWHGAEWNFILWGLYFAVFLILEKLVLHKWLPRWRGFSRVYLWLVASVSFVIFNGADMGQIISDIRGMFGGGRTSVVSAETMYYLRDYAVIYMAAVIGATPLPKKLYEKLQKNRAVAKVSVVLEPIGLLVLVVILTAYLVDGSFNPFLYFRF